ncbi:MAG: hypothetical protein D6770_08785 [Anaerolineae bacterium]|nr:MAG: hypothetical protein D6770_08785 [Anaerolineae bacterium]
MQGDTAEVGVGAGVRVGVAVGGGEVGDDVAVGGGVVGKEVAVMGLPAFGAQAVSSNMAMKRDIRNFLIALLLS